MLLRRRTLSIAGWTPNDDGSVTVTIAIRGRTNHINVRLEPHSPAFSEHLALVASTFTLRFLNLDIQRAEEAAYGPEIG